ncbi:capsule assembly Wzi family protein [Pedobacter mucosus]|uniref:capsule assembly Wzi family protein n=1 Tax=Pedobacter mucosus TaxID=2895286 RepID=UPI001EE4AE9A|nr:capsule assembly Wzi family protein [Pedobacter mucosus]UKT63257.1 capsule assembly Wzi family protein [Pedobacter mucosus]
MRILYYTILFVLFNVCAFSQTLPVGLLENVEDAYRRQQLLGKDTSKSSYMIRPMFMSDRNNLALDTDSTNYSLNNFRKLLFSNAKYKAVVYALPVVWQQQINTHHPYGINDGSMIQANGYQTQFSTGIFAKVGPLSIQLRPELVLAQNKNFTTLQESNTTSEFKNADFIFQNYIDNPERYGKGSYQKLTWGQSSIRLTFDPISLGLSNENLWWGPGIHNSLLMTNNASGFKHVTLNTTRPVNIYIGTIEAQIVGGRLDRSGIGIDGSNEFISTVDKPNDWRYFSGIAFTYQPKWVPGLFLGFDRSFIMYHGNMGKTLGDYLPFLSAVEKAGADPDASVIEDNKERDQYISVFARYVLPESKAEVYFQYGKNDHAYNGRDLFTKIGHTRAYVAGFRKLIPLNRTNEYIQLGLEVTQMEKPPVENVKMYGPLAWYVHGQVFDGYTQLGQVLGAGIGPGSNVQTLDVSWVKGLKRIGLSFERLDHNNDLYFVSQSTDTRRHWVDLAIKSRFSWNFKHLILNSEMTYIHSFNYHYGLIQAPDAFAWDWDHQDAQNLHLKVGLMYQF